MNNRRIMLLMVLSAMAVHFGTACISYSSVPSEVRGSASFADDARDVRLAFIAWSNQGRYTEPIRARFQKGGWTIRSDAPVLLEIILEDKKSTPGLLKFLNFVATAASGTVVPFYNQVNYRLRFRRSREGRVLDTCLYDLRNNEFMSLFFLPAAPFIWSTDVLRKRFEQATDEYMAGCRAMKN